MTHRPIRTLASGTRIYADGSTYTPVPPEKRRKGVRKPADPRAVRWHGEWLLPLPLLPDALRIMPETRSDEEAYEHAAAGRLGCRCQVCMRPGAERWRKKYLTDVRRGRYTGSSSS